jgi:XisI protein
MDKLDQYRKYIQEILETIVSDNSNSGESEEELIIDQLRDHYLLVNVGWKDQKRNYGNSIHVDIKDGKIWIQRDLTDLCIAERLLEKGVPKEDIVLAFHSPFNRQFMDFAVA